MITYFIKAIACLLILLFAHRFLLQREVMHRFNRFFLLFSVVVSFLIPLYTIEVPAEEVAAPIEVNSESFSLEAGTSDMISENIYSEGVSKQLNQEQEIAAVPESQFNWEYLLLGLYGLISLVFLYRFGRNIKVLVNKIQRNIKIKYRGQTLVLLKEDSLPFSFLKYIFVAESDLENGKFTDAVFTHECTHVQEKHSWDILFIEALLIPFWFHPGLHWAKASIKLNHEFIADSVALRSTPLEKYESQLLAMMLSEQKYGLASSLNFSLTKKRFEMMKRKTVSGKSWIKLLVLVPVIVALVYFFSDKVAAKVDDSFIIGEVFVNASDEVDYDLILELKPIGVYISKGKEYGIDEVKLLIEKTEPLENHLTINLITQPEVSMGELADFQAMLRELDIRRIYYYASENQAENTTSKKISEEEKYQDESEDRLPKLTPEQIEEKNKYYKNASFFVENEAGELIPKSYNELSESEKSHLMPPTKAPAKRQPSSSEFESWKNSENFALWFDGKVIPNAQLDNMNPTDVAFFFNSFVHLNARSERFPQEHQVSLYSDEAYESNFGVKSGKGNPLNKDDKFYMYPADKRINFGKPWVKKKNEPISELFNSFPSFDSYLKEMNDYKFNLDEGSHFIKKSEHDQKKLMSQFLDLSGKYLRLSEKEKRQAGKPKHPFAPYLKLSEKGKVVYKMWEDLTESEKLQFPSPHSIVRRSQDLLDYDRQLKSYELNRNNGEHYIKKSDWKKHLSMEQYQQIQKQYSFLALEEKQLTAAPTHPFSPYVKISKGGLDVFKLAKDLTEEERNNMGC